MDQQSAPIETIAEQTGSSAQPAAAAPVEEPAPAEPGAADWVVTFQTDPNGSKALNRLLGKGDEVEQAFYTCFKAVFENCKEGIEKVDTIGFCSSYETWLDLQASSKSLDSDVAVAQGVMQSKLWRCFKELYYIGTITMPAVHFCGCVDTKAMLPGGKFNGYNERSLSLKDATDLKNDMLSNYQSMGLETIFLMCIKPLIELATDAEEGWAEAGEQHPNSVEHKMQLLQQFISKTYSNIAFVPTIAIPSCGK
jgi:hypothetical protein